MGMELENKYKEKMPESTNEIKYDMAERVRKIAVSLLDLLEFDVLHLVDLVNIQSGQIRKIQLKEELGVGTRSRKEDGR